MLKRPEVQQVCGSNSAGRVPPCQGGCREFESLLPLQKIGKSKIRIPSSKLERGVLNLVGSLLKESNNMSDIDLSHVTVPLFIEGNRPFIEITLYRVDGSSRTARFLVDSGGGGFLITEPLARDLGLEWGEITSEDGTEFGVVTTVPDVFVGGFALELDPKRVLVILQTDNILPNAAPGYAQGMLPGHILARYYVVFDYPNEIFTLAQPNVLTSRGDPIPISISKTQGFPRTEIEVDGVLYGFLVDTGASFTMVSEVLLKSWGDTHSDWERYQGAVGEAKTLGGTTLETMFVHSVQWGSYQIQEFGVVSQSEGTFEHYMSSMMTAPIVGSVAGNILKHFRVELDYINSMIYLFKSSNTQ
jgi:predicted aspartyl protease